MDTLRSDCRFVIRQLSKSPGYLLAAVLMLAIGIGATTAIFSIVEAVLLRPLPFPDSDRLMVITDALAGFRGVYNNEVGVTVPDIKAYTRHTNGFSALGGYFRTTFELSGSGEPAQVNGARMTAGVFFALGVNPHLGRVFTAEEDEHSEQVVVLSYTTWLSRFHGDPHVLGTKIQLDRKPYVVIGVMPRTFEFPLLGGQLSRVELWVPMSFQPYELAESAAGAWGYRMVGRLKPGVSAQQAESDADHVAQEIMRNYPASMANTRINAVVRSLKEERVELSRPMLRTLFLAVAVVLLIACVNLAGLMLVRSIRRQREIAVMRALGAGAGALLQRSILESLVLTLSGCALGLVAAGVAVRVGKSLLPESLPRISEIELNWQVAGFALLLGAVTGVLCGLVPALAALRTDLNAHLKEGGRTGTVSSGHARLRSMLVVAEIAIALMLLTASFLLLRSFEKMRTVDIGFQPQHVTAAFYALPESQYPKQSQVDRFNLELLDRLNALPGVTATGLSSTIPSPPPYNAEFFIVEGFTTPVGAKANSAISPQVIGDYFPAMGIPILRGRPFTKDDRHGSPLVVIVNRKLAEHFWPGKDPIGKRLRLDSAKLQTPWMTIVGEVADVKLTSPDQPAREQFYTPVDQVEDELGPLADPTDLNGNSGYIVLRSSGPHEQMESALRSTVRAIDPLLALTQVQTMEQAVSLSEGPRRFITVLIGSFALAAVLLAGLGIYGIIAFSAASRAQEMAIRVALGSQRSAIIGLVLRSGVKLAVIGCIFGLGGAAAASGLLRSLLFGVSPFDPLLMAVAAVSVLLLAVAASCLPALRAASVDPMRALRGE